MSLSLQSLNKEGLILGQFSSIGLLDTDLFSNLSCDCFIIPGDQEDFILTGLQLLDPHLPILTAHHLDRFFNLLFRRR